MARLANGNFLTPLALMPFVATVTATLDDNFSLASKKNPGDTINYTAVITNNTVSNVSALAYTDTLDNNTAQSGTVKVSPVTVDDSYTCTGNLSISINSASGVLANDYLGQNGGTASITASDTTSANGGAVAVAADGSFTYAPAAGFIGADTFHYTLSNSVGSSIGTVTVTVSNAVWFINNTAGACSSSCDGRFSHPFTSLASFIAINDGATNHAKSGHAIFIYQGTSSYTGNLTLLSNQHLIGQGDALNATTLGFTPAANTNVTLPSATAKPTLTGTLTLATGVTALAIDLSTGASNGLVGTTGSSITVGDASPTATNGFTVTTTTGTATSLSNLGGTFTFLSVSASGGANGIFLNNTTGSFTVVGDGSNTSVGGNSTGGTIFEYVGRKRQHERYRRLSE